MPLTRADKIQIDEYIQTGQIHNARRMLQESDDPQAKKALEKLNQQYPPNTAPRPTPATPPPVPSKPAPKSIDMPPELRLDEMDEIKLAIKEKRYDDAESMLILSDHPDADKLRSRLAQMRSSVTNLEGKVKPVYVQQEKDFTNSLVISIVLLFFAFIPGLIALELYAGEARKYPKAPGANALLTTRRVVWFLTILSVVMFVACGLTISNINRTAEYAIATSMARQLR